MRTRVALAPAGTVGLAVLVALLVAGCETRDPANPLDPSNPDTGGEPRWLEALADDGAVDLRWDVPAFLDLAAVRLRDTVGDSLLWRGGAGSHTLRHAPVPNGVDRAYRLELVVEGGPVRALPGEAARPGPEIPWTFDPASGAAWRLTPDGARTRVRLAAPDAAGLVVDPATGDVLVLDFFTGAVRVAGPDGVERWRDGTLFRPLAALAAPGGWWVADPGLGLLARYDGAGARLGADSTFTFPVDLAPAGEGAVWVADGAGGVKRYHPSTGVTGGDSTGFGFVDLVAPSPPGAVWAYDADADRLVRLDAAGARRVEVTGLAGVVDLAADPVVPGGVWFTDRPGRRVVLLDSLGVERGAVEGLGDPASIAVSPDGAVLWIADPTLGAVLRAGRDGAVLSRSTGVTRPVTVSVAFTPGG